LNRTQVVDANVTVKLFVIEEFSPQAWRLFHSGIAGPSLRICVPDLLYLECANILLKYTRRSAYPTVSAFESLARLRTLGLRFVRAADFLPLILELALAYNLSSYDASYAALAQVLQVPFVTADGRLIRKLDGSGIDVIWLGDLPA
jgi:predicted nucleic acid-binding protein